MVDTHILIIYALAIILIALIVVIVVLNAQNSDCKKALEDCKNKKPKVVTKTVQSPINTQNLAVVNKLLDNFTAISQEQSITFNTQDVSLIRQFGQELLYTSVKESQDVPDTQKIAQITQFPVLNQLNDKMFYSTTALFVCYMIQIVYMCYAIPYNSDNKDVLNAIAKQDIFNSGATLQKIITFNCNDTFGNTNTYGGLIFTYNNTTFVIIRGTQSNCEWYENAKIFGTTPSWLNNNNVKVHTGFNNMYSGNGDNSIRNQIMSYLQQNQGSIQNLIIGGHSLGGSLAHMLTADITVNIPSLRPITKVYTIAAAYAGNQTFVDIINSYSDGTNYNGIFNIINNPDLVPTLQESNFQRVGKQLFCFVDGPQAGTLGYSHFTTTYISGIQTSASKFDTNAKNNQLLCGENTCKSIPIRI
jgi:predicted lipase